MKSLVNGTILSLFLTSICFTQWFWQNPLPQGNPLSSVYFTNSNTGRVVEGGGTVLKTTNAGVTFAEEEIVETPTGDNFSQYYLNPFNLCTKGKYSVPQISQVQIKVYDVLGN